MARRGEDAVEKGVGAGPEHGEAAPDRGAGGRVESGAVGGGRRLRGDEAGGLAGEAHQRGDLVGAVGAGGADQRLVVDQGEDAAVEESGGDRGRPGDDAREILRPGIEPLRVGPVVAVAEADEADAGGAGPGPHPGLEPDGKAVAVDEGVVAARRRLRGDLGKLQAGVENQRRRAAERGLDEGAGVVVAHRDRLEAGEARGEARIEALGGGLVAEARGIGGEPRRRSALAVEQRMAAVPRVAEVPDLVAADEHEVIAPGGLGVPGPVEIEGRRQRQALEGGEKGAGLARVGAAVLGARRLGQVGGERAAPLGTVHPRRTVVEQHRPVPAPAQPLDETARLPVGAVVDAAVEGEDADARAHGCTASGARAAASAAAPSAAV